MNERLENNVSNIQPILTQCIHIPFMPMMPKLAHAYVPYQCMVCLYPPMKGLDSGTIFPELDRPYGVDPEYTVDA
jgi:hypothetical protein